MAFEHVRAVFPSLPGTTLSVHAKMILLWIAWRINRNTQDTFVGVRRLMVDSGMSNRGVLSALASLKNLGYINIEPGCGTRPPRYSINYSVLGVSALVASGEPRSPLGSNASGEPRSPLGGNVSGERRSPLSGCLSGERQTSSGERETPSGESGSPKPIDQPVQVTKSARDLARAKWAFTGKVLCVTPAQEQLIVREAGKALDGVDLRQWYAAIDARLVASREPFDVLVVLRDSVRDRGGLTADGTLTFVTCGHCGEAREGRYRAGVPVAAPCPCAGVERARA